MAIHSHLDYFGGRRVREFDSEAGITHPDDAWRVGLTYEQAEDGATLVGLLATFLDDPSVSKVTTLLIGEWEESYDQDSSTIVNALAAAADRLPALRALFLGEIIGEENEISWIKQSDVAPILRAFPQLEEFRVRGGSGLQFTPVEHARLRHLGIEAGGLGGNVVRGICASQFPALEHLELWLGTEDYERSATPADLQTLFSGTLFPSLNYLGIRNSEDADSIAVAVAQAPILSRIKTLDLSLGDLGDDGAEALLASPAVAKLEVLDLHHHYMSKEVAEKLAALGPKVNIDDKQEPDDWGDGEMHRYISVAE